MEENNKVDIHIRILDPKDPKTAPTDLYRISGHPFYIMGVLTSSLYMVAMKAGISLDEIKEITVNEFERLYKQDHERANISLISEVENDKED